MIKINKRMTAFIVSLGLATSSYVLSSCSSSGSTVNELITNDMEFVTVLDSVSDVSMCDDYLEEIDYLDDLERYKELRKKGDFEGSQDAIADFTQNVIMSGVCELLEVELDDIEYEMYEKERFMYPVPACMCKIRYIDSDVVETYELSGLVSDLGLATIVCKKHKAADFDYLEKVYRGSKKFLATSAEHKKRNRIEFEYDKEKVNVMKNNL